MKKQIRIAFVDFWHGFVPEESLFYRILESRYDVVLSDEPDFLFCSTFGEEHLGYDCVKIFYTGENQSPDFNLFDYALGFDRMTFGDRYFRYPNYLLYEKDWAGMKSKAERAEEAFGKKTGFCSFVCSNGLASPERGEFFDKLNEYRHISSGGRFRNNTGGPVKDKLEFLSSHKFDIAFENCSHPGYVTEKIVQSFAACSVPIYWGAPDVVETFNPKAFVNCNDFPSFDAVVERVKEIDNDDTIYLDMLRAPALLAEDPPVEDFLFHIFDQEPSAAFRRSREFWGRRYLDSARAKERAYKMSPRGIWKALYRRTLWKWRRKNGALWKIDVLSKKK